MDYFLNKQDIVDLLYNTIPTLHKDICNYIVSFLPKPMSMFLSEHLLSKIIEENKKVEHVINDYIAINNYSIFHFTHSIKPKKYNTSVMKIINENKTSRYNKKKLLKFKK